MSTKAGDVELRIPKLRKGSFFPALLEPRRRIDRALLAVVMEAYVAGVSTRAVDDLVQALGVESGISKSEVSRICAELDQRVAEFRSRRLDHTVFPYLWLDATYVKARAGGHIVSGAIVVATGGNANGDREVLGIDIGDAESEAFWVDFLRHLRRRGLDGVRLVVSVPSRDARSRRRRGPVHRAPRRDVRAGLAARVRGPRGRSEHWTDGYHRCPVVVGRRESIEACCRFVMISAVERTASSSDSRSRTRSRSPAHDRGREAVSEITLGCHDHQLYSCSVVTKGRDRPQEKG